jgi:hypothetical protein
MGLTPAALVTVVALASELVGYPPDRFGKGRETAWDADLTTVPLLLKTLWGAELRPWLFCYWRSATYLASAWGLGSDTTCFKTTGIEESDSQVCGRGGERGGEGYEAR